MIKILMVLIFSITLSACSMSNDTRSNDNKAVAVEEKSEVKKKEKTENVEKDDESKANDEGANDLYSRLLDMDFEYYQNIYVLFGGNETVEGKDYGFKLSDANRRVWQTYASDDPLWDFPVVGEASHNGINFYTAPMGIMDMAMVYEFMEEFMDGVDLSQVDQSLYSYDAIIWPVAIENTTDVDYVYVPAYTNLWLDDRNIFYNMPDGEDADELVIKPGQTLFYQHRFIVNKDIDKHDVAVMLMDVLHRSDEPSNTAFVNGDYPGLSYDVTSGDVEVNTISNPNEARAFFADKLDIYDDRYKAYLRGENLVEVDDYTAGYWADAREEWQDDNLYIVGFIDDENVRYGFSRNLVTNEDDDPKKPNTITFMYVSFQNMLDEEITVDLTEIEFYSLDGHRSVKAAMTLFDEDDERIKKYPIDPRGSALVSVDFITDDLTENKKGYIVIIPELKDESGNVITDKKYMAIRPDKVGVLPVAEELSEDEAQELMNESEVSYEEI